MLNEEVIDFDYRLLSLYFPCLCVSLAFVCAWMSKHVETVFYYFFHFLQSCSKGGVSFMSWSLWKPVSQKPFLNICKSNTQAQKTVLFIMFLKFLSDFYLLRIAQSVAHCALRHCWNIRFKGYYIKVDTIYINNERDKISSGWLALRPHGWVVHL